MKKVETRTTRTGGLRACRENHPQSLRLRRVRIFLFSALLAAAFLASCAATATPSPISPAAPSPTLPPSPLPLFTASPLPPSPSPTPPFLPCDPQKADYCITDRNFPLRRPIAAPGNEVIDPTYPFASTAGGTREPHHGVEFPNASGTPVLAAADGSVVFAGNDAATRFGPWTNFYGNLVVLEHPLPGGTIFTLYAHLSSVSVLAGQTVRAGEKIGEVGATGAAIGSHLHFEVRLEAQDYDRAQNPELWLTPLPGAGILSIRLVNGEGQFVDAPLSVQYFPAAGGAFAQAWQPEIYPPSLTVSGSWENALLGSLQPGRYRITFLWDGVWQERWVEVQAGKVTAVEFVMR